MERELVGSFVRSSEYSSRYLCLSYPQRVYWRWWGGGVSQASNEKGKKAKNIVMWSLADNVVPTEIQISFVSVIKF